MRKEKKHLINEEIRCGLIRLVGGSDGSKNITLKEAIEEAMNLDMDLVLLKSDGNIGICKIMNYDKFLYEQGKKEKQKTPELKEIKVGPNTSENDLSYRIKHMVEFLEKGHKVKITMQFKGREMAYVSNGELLMLNMIKAVEEHGLPEAMPKLENKRMFVTIRPKNNK